MVRLETTTCLGQDRHGNFENKLIESELWHVVSITDKLALHSAKLSCLPPPNQVGQDDHWETFRMTHEASKLHTTQNTSVHFMHKSTSKNTERPLDVIT